MTRQEIVEAYFSGKSANQIARELACSEAQIRTIIREDRPQGARKREMASVRLWPGLGLRIDPLMMVELRALATEKKIGLSEATRMVLRAGLDELRP